MENRGVRKGAWTKDEDILLRNCIEKYGEGSWHKVPLRAGLNRCRKSCRLRWLNYLRPNLKRGCFAKDEVELIVRLHKLLGNRWSLIAGRLPGRTGNDVKNFWNSHIAKNLLATGKCCKQKSTQRTITTTNIIKPRPRTLTISKLHLPVCPNEVTKTNDPNDENLKNKQPSSSAMLSQEEQNDWKNIDENTKNNETTTFLSREVVDECIQWWSSFLQISENGEEFLCPFSDDDALCGLPKSHADIDGLMDRSSIDVDVWELLSYDHQ